MSDNHLHALAIDIEVHINCTSRLASRDAKIDASNIAYGVRREESIPVSARSLLQRIPIDRIQAGGLDDAFNSAGIAFGVRPKVKFLKTDDVRIDFPHDPGDAIRITTAVPTEAPMNVVGSD